MYCKIQMYTVLT